jgi:hypothetical protein
MRAFAGLLACVLLPACGGVAERQTEQAALPASQSTAAAQAQDTPAPTAAATATTTVDQPAPADVPEFRGSGNVSGGVPEGPAACTLVDCVDGFLVKFEKSTPWRSGSYRVRLREDGREIVDCNAVVPEPSAASEIRHDCPRDTLELLGDGATRGIWGAHVSTLAERVAIEIADAEQQLGQAEYLPVWQESRPNGPQCDPVCITASEETLVLE